MSVKVAYLAVGLCVIALVVSMVMNASGITSATARELEQTYGGASCYDPCCSDDICQTSSGLTCSQGTEYVDDEPAGCTEEYSEAAAGAFSQTWYDSDQQIGNAYGYDATLNAVERACVEVYEKYCRTADSPPLYCIVSEQKKWTYWGTKHVCTGQACPP